MPFGPHRVTQLIEDVAQSYVEGRDPFQIETMWRQIYSSGYCQHPDLTLTYVTRLTTRWPAVASHSFQD